MKKTVILALMAVIALFSAHVYAGTPINKSELPKAALTFINKHFSGDNLKKAEKDQGRRGMEYEVDLISGAEIDFRENGDWKEVKAAKGKAVPEAIIPPAIVKYVSTNHAGQNIVEISRKRGGFEIELSNGTEIKLTEDAKPLKNQSRPTGNPRR